jgi:DNA-directed RNA polymerase subunit RPC12/RpoP
MDNENIAEHTHQQELVCKNCGAKQVYAPGTMSLACEYCGTMNEIEVKSEEIKELDLEAYITNLSESAPTIDILTVKCNSCSAQTTFDPNVVSNFCAFCGSPIVVKDASTNKVFKPKGILPFHVDKKSAEKAYLDWLGKIWWAPFGFKKQVQMNEKLTGMYIPYWTYDSDTSSDYFGERGDNYTVMVSYTTTENGKTVTRQRPETRIRWTPASGNVTHFFDDVLVIASNSLPRAKTEKLEPWDLSNMVPFDEAYISGFRTECYQVDLKDGLSLAKQRMGQEIELLVKEDIGGDHQRIASLDTAYSNLTFKHILLPIWISAYRYNAKAYRYMVNGRTGEVQGEYPVSVLKIILVIIAVAALVLMFIKLQNG